MKRYFTLTEATALVPRVERHLRDAMDAESEYRRGDEAFRAVQERIQMSGGALVDGEKVVRIVFERGGAAVIRQQELETIERMGVQVKDLEIGLIDFPTIYRDEEVLLCWRMGEDGIEFWHGCTEGFRGRKLIDRDFLDHHRSEPKQ